MGLGEVEEARQAIKKALVMDPTDTTNKADQNLMEEVVHQAQMIEKYGADPSGMSDDIDYEKAASYCASILKNCPGALHYTFLRIRFLLQSNQLKEAEKFSKELFESDTTNPRIMAWYGRVLVYNGNEAQGKKLLTKCLEFDPDNKDAVKALKAMKVAAVKKEEASEMFKSGKLDQAIKLFDECI